MTAARYLDRFDAPQRRTVTTMGTQAGPGGGDGWSVVAGVPAARLPAGHYAFIVTGRIVNLQVYGSTPPSGAGGRLQVCLGDSAGTKSANHLYEVSVNDVLPGDNGQPFQFMAVLGSGVSDPTWGSSWSGSADLQVLARGWWSGDATTYGVTFDVCDLAFTWALLDSITAGDVVATQVTALSGGDFVGAASVGALGETWLHFWAVNYRTGATTSSGTQTAPRLNVGYRTNPALGSSHVEKVGTTNFTGPGRLGLGGGPYVFPAIANQARSMGSFWFGQRDASPAYPACKVSDLQTGATPTIWDRFTVVSVKLDNLPSVRTYASGQSAVISDTYPNRFDGGRFVPVEVPAGELTSEPWVLATGIVKAFVGFSVWCNTQPSGRDPCRPIGRDIPRGGLEAIPTFSIGSHTIAAGEDAFRYLVRWIAEPGYASTLPEVWDVYVVTLFPVRSPDNVSVSIPTVGAAVAIVPGTEGLDPTSLTDLPILPDSQMPIAMSGGTKERTDGATGYVRTWTVFLSSRRSWQLRWSGMSATQRTTLLAFLQSTPTFRMLPPGGNTKVAVTVVEPAATAIEGGIWTITASVAELIYRG